MKMRKFKRWLGRRVWPDSVRCPEEQRCLELARQMLDDESTSADTDYVLKHVEGCYQCYDNYNVEKEIRAAVKRKSRNLQIPQDVMKKIKMKIRVK